MKSILSEIGYGVASALAPSLSRERYATWRLSRRALAATLAAVLLSANAVPAQAQTTDFAALAQRGVEFAKNAWREIKTDMNWLETHAKTDYWALRQMAASYEDYKNAKAIYQRVTNPATSISLIQAMPILEVYGGGSNGVEDHYVLRPVIRPHQRLNPPRLPNLQLPDFSSIWDAIRHGDVDIDLDHFTVVKKADDSTLTPAELAKRSIEDGWGNWRQAQELSHVEENFQNVPFDANTYAGLTMEVQAHFMQRRKALQAMAETLSARGPEDPLYQRSLKAISDLDAALSSGKAELTAAELRERLLKIDGQATEVVAIYARLRQAVGEVARRQGAKQDNLSAIKRQYRQQDDVLSFTAWFNKAGRSGDDPKNKEALSNQIQANAHAEDTALSEAESLKNRLLSEMQERNDQLRELGIQKAHALAEMRSAMGDAWYSEQLQLLTAQIEAETEVSRCKLILAKLPSPAKIPLVLPDQLAQRIPGSIPASSGKAAPNAAEAIATALPGKMADRTTVVTSYARSSTALRLPVLGTLFAALDSGARAVLGKSFNLSSWGA